MSHRRDEKCIQNFGGKKPEGKRPLGRPRRRWEDKLECSVKEKHRDKFTFTFTDLREIGWEM
jgi:hypothetical protein